MGIFDKIKEASMMEGGAYVLPGIYRVQIDVCKQKETRKKIGMVAVEMRVLESSNPDRPPGSAMSWVVTADKDAFLSNIKQFLSAVGIPINGVVHRLTPEDVDPAGAEMVFSAGNPLKGHFARIYAYNVLTKAKTDFTRVKWINDQDGVEGVVAAVAAGQAQKDASDEDEKNAAAMQSTAAAPAA